MISMIVTALVGILLCVLGGVNMTGNISSLHYYHRKRVKEEDKKPFGLLIGLGSIIMGISIIALGVFMYVFEQNGIFAYFISGCVVFGVGIIVGLGLNFFAMIKYNKVIF